MVWSPYIHRSRCVAWFRRMPGHGSFWASPYLEAHWGVAGIVGYLSEGDGDG